MAISRTQLKKIIKMAQQLNKIVKSDYLRGYEMGMRFVYDEMKEKKK